MLFQRTHIPGISRSRAVTKAPRWYRGLSLYMDQRCCPSFMLVLVLWVPSLTGNKICSRSSLFLSGKPLPEAPRTLTRWPEWSELGHMLMASEEPRNLLHGLGASLLGARASWGGRQRAPSPLCWLVGNTGTQRMVSALESRHCLLLRAMVLEFRDLKLKIRMESNSVVLMA